MHIFGSPQLTLYCVTSAAHADFTGKLVRLRPGGQADFVCIGIARSSYLFRESGYTRGRHSLLADRRSSPPPVSLPPAMRFGWKWPAAPFPCTTAIHPPQCSPGLRIRGTGSARPRWCCMMRSILPGWNCHWRQPHEYGIASTAGRPLQRKQTLREQPAGAAADRPHHRQGRICQPDRPFRLRQVHPAQAHLRPHQRHAPAASWSTA